jgi:methylglyoxal synthase
MIRIALVAHDDKKADMVAFALRHRDSLSRCTLFATGTTGGRILEQCPEFNLTRLKSGPLGGDQQIGALIATGDIDALIFLVDPLSPHPHDVDVKALMRLALVYNIPMALNLASAEMVMHAVEMGMDA